MLRNDEVTIPIGMLPGGSGNSLMCDLGTWDIEEAATRVADGHVYDMDLNETETMGKRVWSMNEVTFGLIGDVGIVAEGVRFLGPARYNAVGAWSILKEFKCHMKLDIVRASGEKTTTEGDFVTVAIMHSQHLGKGLRLAPTSQLDDGLMDIAMVRAGRVTRGEGLAVLNQLPDGSHVTNPNLIMDKVVEVTVTLPSPGVFNLDGEMVLHNGRVHMKVHKKKVSVIATQSTRHGNVKGASRLRVVGEGRGEGGGALFA
jgi:diacylglycerol kinase family enzyme